MLPSAEASPFAAFSTEQDPPLEDQRTIKRKNSRALPCIPLSLSLFHLFDWIRSRLRSMKFSSTKETPEVEGDPRQCGLFGFLDNVEILVYRTVLYICEEKKS